MVGGTADLWAGLKENLDGSLSFSGITGTDGGVSLGASPGVVSGSVVFSNANPLNKVVRNKLTDLGLMKSPFVRAYVSYVDEVTYNPSMSCFGLFVCRLAFQCGRGSEMWK